MKNKSKIIYFLFVALSVFLLLEGLLFSQEEELPKIFQLKGKTYTVAASSPAAGSSDILFHGEISKNLSRDIPGENVLPQVVVSGDYFYVSWINYKKGDVSLCFYDSAQDCSRVLAAGGFKFIGAAPGIVFDRHLPRVLIFRANNSTNVDLFGYSFLTGAVKRITRTPACERTFFLKNNITSDGTVGHIDEINERDSYSTEKTGFAFLESTEASIIIETRTLYHHFRYLFKPENLESRSIYKKEIPRPPVQPVEMTPETINTYIAFGDSITWGKMRMNDLPFDPTGEYRHPEFAYPQKIKETLETIYGYGKINYYSLGEPGGDTYTRMENIYGLLQAYSGKYFLLMLGTNDAYKWIQFELNQSLENLEYIVDAALSKNMRVVISTIPPRNDGFNTPLVVAQIEALNAGIIALAGEKNIKYIDTYTAFRKYNSPWGWESLLEDRGASFTRTGEAGQHPSPLGHQVITELFVPRILEFPPEAPAGISTSQEDKGRVSVQWDENYEFDLSHYEIVFGYMPGSLNLSLSSDSAAVTFIRPPFFSDLSQQRVYFSIRAVDDSGNSSDFSTISNAVFD